MRPSSPLERNPYAPPETISSPAHPTESDPRSSLLPVRIIFGIHLAAIALPILFMNRFGEPSQYAPGFVQVIGYPLVIAFVFALPLCPVAMVVAVIKLRRPALYKFAIIAAEVLLALFHLWAMLPAVQKN